MRKTQRKSQKGRWIAALLVLLALCGAAALIYPTARQDIESTLIYPKKFSAIVEREADAYDLDENLVYAVIKAESNFDPEAESAAGALGLMQMMPETFTWMQTHVKGDYSTASLRDPETNIRFGCALLRVLLNEFKNEETAVCAYNAGIGNVTSWLQNTTYSADGVTLFSIPFGETRHYVSRVMEYKAKYQELYGGNENV